MHDFTDCWSHIKNEIFQEIHSIWNKLRLSYWKNYILDYITCLVTKIVVKKDIFHFIYFHCSLSPWDIKDVRQSPLSPALCQEAWVDTKGSHSTEWGFFSCEGVINSTSNNDSVASIPKIPLLLIEYNRGKRLFGFFLVYNCFSDQKMNKIINIFLFHLA